MSDIYANLPQLAADSLLAKASEVVSLTTGAPNEWQLKFSDLTTDALQEMLIVIAEKLGKKNQSIYVFSLLDDALEEDLREAFAYKEADRAFARLNKPNVKSAFRCIYVGSSHDTTKRIREHLGLGYQRTSAMHLNSWADCLAGSFQITVLPYDHIPSDLLQILEDQLSDEMKPILGKKGGK